MVTMPLATPTAERPMRSGTLQDTRNFARLSHFLHVFHEALTIDTFDIEQLETELSQVEGDNYPLLRQVVKRALRTLTGNRNIDDSRLEVYIARAWEKYNGGSALQTPVLPDSFGTLGLFGIGAADRTRVVLETCELMFCRPDNLRSIGCVAKMDARAWRITPVGIDDLHRRYWLLCNNRLYRETPRRIAGVLLGDDEQETDEAKDTGNDTLLRKHNDGDKCSSSDTPALRRRSTRISAQMAAAEAEAKVKLEAGADEAVELPSAEDIELSDPPRHRMREEDGDLWELVCSTANDWSSFPQTFIRSKSKNERALYRALSAVAPEIASALHSAARRRHMQVAVAYRKRSSRIATKELHSQEELHRQAVLQHRLDEQYGLASGRRMSKRLRSQIGNEPSTSDSESYMDQHQVLAKDRHVRAQRRATARLQAMEDAAIAQSLRKAGKQSASASATEDESDDPEDWMFSCSCGKSGHNYDDGRAMTACEKCGVWRHLGCALRGEAQRIGKEIDEDDWESIHYVCPQCIGSSNQVS